MIKDARAKRLMERKQKRKHDRRMKWLAEKEEAEQQRRDEEAKRGEWIQQCHFMLNLKKSFKHRLSQEESTFHIGSVCSSFAITYML